MSDLIVLVAAVLACTASGVLLAYGVCLGLFRMFKMHAAQTAIQQPVPVAAPQIAQS